MNFGGIMPRGEKPPSTSLSDMPTIPCCPHCERPLSQSAAKDGLMVQSGPWAVSWQGHVLKGLTPMAMRFLFLLLRSPTGEVATSSFDVFLREDASPSSTKVHIHRLRAWLASAGLPFAVQNIHGWGYLLVGAERNP